MTALSIRLVDPDRPPPGDMLPPVSRGWLVRRASSLLPWTQVALARRRMAMGLTAGGLAASVALHPWLASLGLAGFRRPSQAWVLTCFVGLAALQALSFVLRSARSMAGRRAFRRQVDSALPPGRVVQVRGRIAVSAARARGQLLRTPILRA